METVKYCSPGVFSYTAFFTVQGGARRASRGGKKKGLVSNDRACVSFSPDFWEFGYLSGHFCIIVNVIIGVALFCWQSSLLYNE